MRSFEYDYLLEHPLSHGLLMTVRALGEYRGRQGPYEKQSPEALETLRRIAMVQSVESSNRIEGVIMAADRLQPLVEKKTTPRDRSEAELQDACPGISYPTLKRALADLKTKKKVRCLGKGRDALWERIGSWSR